MNAHEYVLVKQIEWAKNRGIELIGSQRERGRRTYAPDLNGNLFEPLSDDVRQSFEDGDGDELGSSDRLGKMQAVHSSSALGVNVFHYWKQLSAAPVIAAMCGLCRRDSRAPSHFVFEEKYPINQGFSISPNIDVVIHNQPSSKIQRLAIECKFSEAYGSHGHGGIKQRYLTECDPLWDDIPSLRKLAERISPHDNEFRHLHPAQLIKHVLGLKRAVGLDRFRLLYLWYDVFGPEGMCHREEIAAFSEVAKKDGVMFHSLTYQELICRMASELRPEHEAYIYYVTERYL